MLTRRYPRNLTAVHEAGHAVVAAALDVYVEEVDIQLRRRPAGPGGAVIEVAGCCHRHRGSQRDEIAIALAGALAEVHICKVEPGAGCQNDFLDASFIAA